MLNPAHNYYEIKVTSVQANVKVPVESVPEAVRTATAPPLTVQTQKLADGVWVLGSRELQQFGDGISRFRRARRGSRQ